MTFTDRRRQTYRVVGQQAGVVVQNKPAVLPAFHDVSPLAKRPLHDGRHLYNSCGRGGVGYGAGRRHARDAAEEDDGWDEEDDEDDDPFGLLYISIYETEVCFMMNVSLIFKP